MKSNIYITINYLVLLFLPICLYGQNIEIGFTSYGGKAGRMLQKKYSVPKPGKNSFENWINKSYDFAFTDFKKLNTGNPDAHELFFMSGSIKGNAFHTHHKAEWNRIFDGVFFIRNMVACEDITK